MEGFKEKIRRKITSAMHGADHRGLSLVEIICAVAIFSVITATIGGVLVFSSRTYSRGSTEAAVQQEAQFAANRISGIIQNATAANFMGSTLTLEKGNVTYQISLDDEKLNYVEVDTASGSPVGSPQVLAENITAFQANVDNFDEAHTVVLDLTVAKDGRNYPVTYTMNARNEEISVSTSILSGSATLVPEDTSVILVPGQEYPLGVEVRGSTNGYKVESVSSSDIVATPLSDKLDIKVNKDTTTDSATVQLATNDMGTDAVTPCDRKTVQVDVRKVNSVELQKGFMLGSGESLSVGAEYTFYAKVNCTNGAKVAGAFWENGYQNPYAVKWEWDLYIGDTIDNDRIGEYFYEDSIYPIHEEDVDTPYITFKLKKNFDANTRLVVRATSKHATGTNKAGSAYGVAADGTVGAEYFAEAELAGPKLKKTEILLVPGQSYTLNGVLVANPEITTTPASLAAGTSFTMDANNKLKIVIGRDEKGDSNGDITLDIHSAGSTDTVLQVVIHIRRVNTDGSFKIDYQFIEGNGRSPNGEWGKSADYQFKSRVKGTNLEYIENSGYLNAETQAQYEQYSPYAVEFSWMLRKAGTKTAIAGTEGSELVTFYDFNATQTELKKDASGKKYSDKFKNSYFHIVSFALNKHSPAINVHMEKAFEADWELVITAKAIHPNMDGTQGRNKPGSVYTENAATYVEYTYIHKMEGLGPIIDPDDPVDDNDINFLDDIKRGQDYASWDHSNFANHETPAMQAAAYADGFDWNKAQWFFRVREILEVNGNTVTKYGEWTTYRKTMENSWSNKKLNAEETRSFLPDKRYQLEMALLVVDRGTNTLLWPYDPSITAPGSGTGFEGWKNGWSAGKSTPKDDYSSTYNIGRACITFKKDGNTYRSYGSLESPVVLHPGDWFQIDLDGYTIEYGHYQGKCYARFQELVGNTWVEVGNKGWTYQDRSNFFLLKDIKDSAKGTYRISFRDVDNGDADWTYWNGSMWDPKYIRYQNTQFLLCGSNGTAGYIYIKIE